MDTADMMDELPLSQDMVILPHGDTFDMKQLRFDATSRRILSNAKEAYQRIEQSATRTFQDWVQIGYALDTIRNAVKRRLNTNKGRLHNDLIGEVLRRAGLWDIPKDVRSRLLAIMDNLKDVQSWYASLDASSRIKWNHPNTILREWNAAKNTGVKDKPERTKKPEVELLEERVQELEQENEELTRKLRDLEFEKGSTEQTRENVIDILKERRELEEKVRELEAEVERLRGKEVESDPEPEQPEQKTVPLVFRVSKIEQGSASWWVIRAKWRRPGRAIWFDLDQKQYLSQEAAFAAVDELRQTHTEAEIAAKMTLADRG